MIYKGISRNIDDLGRIVIPKEVRRILSWEDKELLDIKLFGKYVLICAHDDTHGHNATMNFENPICVDVLDGLKRLSSDDFLYIYQLVKRMEY